jgi:hypothetical protein
LPVSHHAKRWLRRGLLLLGLLLAIMPAASPYFGSGEVPRTNDIFPHLYRVLALDLMVGDGHIWPRWSSDLVHGFGYPVFNFFPSLSHWAVEIFHLLGLPLTTAYRLVVVVHLWLAAVGAYGLGRIWLRPAAAWLVGVAYAYSPYMLYDFHVRGSLPEGQALALLPFLLLALWQTTTLFHHREHGEHRVGWENKTRYSLRSLRFIFNKWTAVTALLFAAALLSHPVVYPLMLPVGLWFLVLAWRHGWRVLVGPAVGLVKGVLLSAFLWLPALLEVRFTRAAVTAEQGYNYRDNFLTLAQLLDWPRLPADPALLNPPVVRALPVVALLLALAFLLAWLWRRGRPAPAQKQALFDWSLILVVATGLILPAARPVWDTVPLLAQTLFPWRFLALASLAGAMLLGLAVELFLEDLNAEYAEDAENRRSKLLRSRPSVVNYAFYNGRSHHRRHPLALSAAGADSRSAHANGPGDSRTAAFVCGYYHAGRIFASLGGADTGYGRHESQSAGRPPL